MTYTVDDVNKLYQSIGEAVWNLQHLENVMTTYNALKILQNKRENNITFTDEEAYNTLNNQRKLTLGPLISSAKQHQMLPKDLEKRFDKFLTERNWLIHKCVISDYLSLQNAKSKSNLFSRISNFVEETISLKIELNNQMQKWFVDKGYNLNLAYTLAEEIIEKSK